ncbi:hypothetical protein L209DRAFT_744027 [Thermothelomyces heterothallicus CBS 203.75]
MPPRTSLTATLTALSEAATPRPSARKAASKPAPKRKEPFFDPKKENWSVLKTWKPILFPYEPCRYVTITPRLLFANIKKDKKAAPYYFGFYTDDWFRAVYTIYFFGERRPVIDNTCLDRLLYQGDPKYKYIASLKIGTSLSTIRKDMIRSKRAKAAALNERLLGGNFDKLKNTYRIKTFYKFLNAFPVELGHY